MPAVSKFLNHFNLVSWEQFDGFTLSKVHSTHEQKIRYKLYKYQITLIFTDNGQGNYEDLFDDLLSEIEKEPIIWTRYGNPYRCWIDYPQEGSVVQQDDTFIFHLIGHAERI